MDKFITLGGVKYPIHFGLAALSNFCRDQNIPIGDLQDRAKDFSLEMSIKLILEGLRQGARRAKTQLEMEWEDIADMFDDNPDEIVAAMSIFGYDAGAPDTEKSGNVKPAVKKTPVKK